MIILHEYVLFLQTNFALPKSKANSWKLIIYLYDCMNKQ